MSNPIIDAMLEEGNAKALESQKSKAGVEFTGLPVQTTVRLSELEAGVPVREVISTPEKDLLAGYKVATEIESEYQRQLDSGAIRPSFDPYSEEAAEYLRQLDSDRIRSIGNNIASSMASGAAAAGTYAARLVGELQRGAALAGDESFYDPSSAPSSLASGPLAGTIKAGEDAQKFWKDYFPTPASQKGSFWFEAVPQGVGSFAAAIPAAVAAPGLGLTVMFGMEGEDAYQREIERQRKAGEEIDPDKALAKSGFYAAGATAIESKLGLGRIARKVRGYFGKEAANQLVEKSLKEGLSEKSLLDFVRGRAADTFAGATEEGSQRLLLDLIIDMKPDWEAIRDEALVGGVLQGALGGVASGANIIHKMAIDEETLGPRIEQTYEKDSVTGKYQLPSDSELTRSKMRDLVILNNPEITPAIADLFMGVIDAHARAKSLDSDSFIQEYYRDIDNAAAEFALEQKVYHGTRVAGITEFSNDFIGEGQGAASFGWGNYQAEAQGVAESIEKQLGGISDIVWNSPEGRFSRNENLSKANSPLAEDVVADITEKGSISNAETFYKIALGGFGRMSNPDTAAFEYTKQKAAWLQAHGNEIELKSNAHLYTAEVDDAQQSKFLLWDRPISMQPASVVMAIDKLKDFTMRNINSTDTGANVYAKVVEFFNGDQKKASLKLLELGIIGNKYLDQQSRRDTQYRLTKPSSSGVMAITTQDGEKVLWQGKDQAEARTKLAELNKKTYNYVLFDPKSSIKKESIKMLRQGGKGSVSFLADTRAVMHLFAGADLSTLLHEHAHVMLRTLTDAQLQIIADWAKVDVADLIAFRNDPKSAMESKAFDSITKAQELWAVGFEKYLTKGTAPSKALQGLFQMAKEFLRRIYLLAKDTRISEVAIPESVRQVYDSLFITDAEKFSGKVANSLGAEFKVVEKDSHPTVEVLFNNKMHQVRVDNLIAGRDVPLDKDAAVSDKYKELQRKLLGSGLRWISPLENPQSWQTEIFQYERAELEAMEQGTLVKLADRLGMQGAKTADRGTLITFISQENTIKRKLNNAVRTTYGVDEGALLVSYAKRFLTAMQAEEGHLFRGLIEYFFNTIVERVRTVNGIETPVSRDAYERGLKAINTMCRYKKGMAQILRDCQELVNGSLNLSSDKHKVVVELRELVQEGNTFKSKLQLAVEDPYYEGQLSKPAQEAVKKFRKVILITGIAIEKAGVKIAVQKRTQDQATGKWKNVTELIPFKADPDGRKFERHWTPEGLSLLTEDSDALRAELADALSRMPGNTMGKAYYLKQLKLLGEATTRKAHQEFARNIPNMPVAFKTQAGQVVHILRTEAMQLAEQMVDSTSAYLGFRDGFGDSKEAAIYMQNFKTITGQVKDLERLYKALNHIPLSDDTMLQSGTIRADVEQYLHDFIMIWKAGKLSAAAIVNFPESMRLAGTFGSQRDYHKALARILKVLLTGDKNALGELYQTSRASAALSNTVANYIIRKDPRFFFHDIAKVISSGLMRTTLVASMNSINEIIATQMGLETLKRFKMGQGTAWDKYRLELLKFTPEDISILVDNPKDPRWDKLASNMLNMLPVLTQGTPQIPAMQSAFGNWKGGNDVYAFTSFFRMNAMRTYDILRGAYQSREKVTYKDKIIPWMVAGAFFGNSSVAGLMALALRSLVFVGPVALAYVKCDEDDDGLVDDWLRLLSKGFVSTMFGGPIDFIMRQHEQKGDRNTLHALVDSTVPGAIFKDMQDLVERYHNGTPIGDVALRIVQNYSTLTPAFSTWASMMYLGSKNVPLSLSLRKFYNYKKAHVGNFRVEFQAPVGGTSKEYNEKLMLHNKVREGLDKIQRATLAKGNPKDPLWKQSLTYKRDPSVWETSKDLWKSATLDFAEALGDKELFTGRDRAASLQSSLMAKRTVMTLKPEKMEEFRKEVGDNTFNLLMQYDAILTGFAQAIGKYRIKQKR
jgi:hypothetical protein